MSERKSRGLKPETQTGFTMVELLVAIAIVGLLMAVSVPGSVKMYQSIQYRQSVRDILTMLGTARQEAIDKGSIRDVSFNVNDSSFAMGDDKEQLPSGFSLSLTTASEVNRDGLGVVRFYPEGGSSGGDIIVESPSGRTVMISVDWLMGAVSQAVQDG